MDILQLKEAVRPHPHDSLPPEIFRIESVNTLGQ